MVRSSKSRSDIIREMFAENEYDNLSDIDSDYDEEMLSDDNSDIEYDDDIETDDIHDGKVYLRLGRNSKAPTERKWTEGRFYRDINTSYNNIGFITGSKSGITVVDLDTEDLINMPVFKNNITRTVKTPHGYHLYYEYEAQFGNSVGIVGSDGVRYKVDIRNNNGYVVCPPSVVNNKTYSVSVDMIPQKMNRTLLRFLQSNGKGKKAFKPVEMKRNTLPISLSEDVSVAISLVDPNTWTFRRCDKIEDGVKVWFKRLKSSKCDLCDRTHDNDNTLYIVIYTNGAMIRYCTRTTNNTILKYSKVDDFSKDTFNKINNKKLSFSTTAGIKYVRFNSKYINNKVTLDTDITGIRSPMGTGKTYFTAKNVIPSQPKVFEICHRVSLIQDKLNGKYKNLGFVSYQDVKEINSDINRCITTVESMGKCQISPDMAPDLLILDEIRGVRSQLLTSPYIRSGNIFANFCWYVKYSKKILMLDADLTPDLMQWIRDIRYGDNVSSKAANCVFYHNVNNTNVGKTASFYQDRTLIENLIVQKLNSGENVFIASCDGVNKQAMFKKKLSSECKIPIAQILVINSKTKAIPAVKRCIEHPETWSSYRVVIISPTITVGTSYDEDHFQSVFGLFNNATICHEDALQMLGRVRRYSSNKMYINVTMRARNLPTQPNDVIEYLQYNQNKLNGSSGVNLQYSVDYYGNRHYVVTPFYKMFVDATVQRNRSLNQFMEKLILNIKDHGYMVAYFDATADSKHKLKNYELNKKFMKEVKLENAVALKDATYEGDLTHLEIKNSSTPELMTDVDHRELLKGKTLELFNGVLDDTTTSDEEVKFMHTYADYRVHRNYVLQCDIFDDECNRRHIKQVESYAIRKDNEDIRSNTKEYSYPAIKEALKLVEFIGFDKTCNTVITGDVIKDKFVELVEQKAPDPDLKNWLTLFSKEKVRHRLKLFTDPTPKAQLKTQHIKFFNSCLNILYWKIATINRKKGAPYKLVLPTIFTYGANTKRHVPRVKFKLPAPVVEEE